MDVLYKIVGVKAVGNRICLSLKHVESDKGLSTSGIIKNPRGFMDSIKQDAMVSRNPDQVSITLDEFEKGGFNLGEVVSITIKAGV